MKCIQSLCIFFATKSPEPEILPLATFLICEFKGLTPTQPVNVEFTSEVESCRVFSFLFQFRMGKKETRNFVLLFFEKAGGFICHSVCFWGNQNIIPVSFNLWGVLTCSQSFSKTVNSYQFCLQFCLCILRLWGMQQKEVRGNWNLAVLIDSWKRAER